MRRWRRCRRRYSASSYGSAYSGVRDVTVTASPTAPPCDTTVDLVAVVTPNDRPGTISYR